MARKSKHSNKTKKDETGDSTPDSDGVEPTTIDAKQVDDAPVVIEGEAEDITGETPDTDDAEKIVTASDQLEDDSAEDQSAPEDVVEVEPEPEVEGHPDPAPVVAAEQKRGSVVPLVFGGLVAGVIGYGASHYGVLTQEQPAPVDTSALDARFDALSGEIGALSSDYAGLVDDVAGISSTDVSPLTERLDALSADLEALQNAPAPAAADVPSDLIGRIDALEADMSSEMTSLNDQLAVMQDRLSALAETALNPAEGMGDQLAAFQSELDQLTAQAKSQVEEATAEVTAAKARASEFEQQAAEAAALAERKGAIAALVSAVENGGAFTDELSFFDDPPKALTATAENGVPSLGALQRAFPDMARAALASATVVPQDASAGDRLTAFLKRQTNARSLSPKEGDGADAVLSRAEASVTQGDLVASLAELSSLPDETKEVLAPWMSNAQARLDALAALNEISAAEN